MSKYDDIINMKRPQSKRDKMSIENRAAQFAPFSALSGYNDACREVERITDNKKILSDGVLDIINEKLNYIKRNISDIGIITVKYFVKDLKKNGGSYQEKSGYVKKIDVNDNAIYFKDGTIIKFNDILMIDIENFNV
ncbi:MAG: hypothetical protein IJA30_04405 [Bacilli bacterium]|nr:hypothetical protein [Bacilli bacterium]